MTKSPLSAQNDRRKDVCPAVPRLFRGGDFYHTFDADADSLARVLGLAKTCRGDRRRMAGFPHMQLGRFLLVLIGAGLRVAVIDPGDTNVAVRADVPKGKADA